jgi:hypothetical protein
MTAREGDVPTRMPLAEDIPLHGMFEDEDASPLACAMRAVRDEAVSGQEQSSAAFTSAPSPIHGGPAL